MKIIFLFILVICHSLFAFTQDLSAGMEQQLENLADQEQTETEDDAFLQQLTQFRRDPLNLNTAEKNELRELRLLNDLQIDNFIRYRRLLGRIADVHELQAVPAWDIITIRRLLPVVTIGTSFSVKVNMLNRFEKGDHSLLLRVSQLMERTTDIGDTVAEYKGSPQRMFFRYRYNYKDLLQYGLTGDKDAGEQFFKGVQKRGFDFYSFHMFSRKTGIIRALALGDFTASMGQGLIHWQGLAFNKSAEVMSVKRQSPVLRPYNSSGEFYFHRGAGITIRKNKWELTSFISFRKLSTTLVMDSLQHPRAFSSFQTSGYHRTQNEVDDRNNMQQTAVGGNVNYTSDRMHIGINGILYRFSVPLQKKDEVYNLFALRGSQWYNASIDYSYTYKNLHLFGEAAIDKHLHKAFVNGLLVSVDAGVDVSIVHRVIAREYQAVNANAFTENSVPSNENGIYAGITIRPVSGWRLDAYADIYKFPWLKYRVDAPSWGRDFLVQLTYSPNRRVELYARFKNGSKQRNQPDNNDAVSFIAFFPKQNLRLHTIYKISKEITLRNRVELIWYGRYSQHSFLGETEARETGFLTYFDFIYKLPMRPLSGIVRLQYFETGGYDSRLYAYENDVLFSYSIPVYFGKGYRYYLTLNFDLDQNISFWLRCAQTLSYQKETTTDPASNRPYNSKLELKFQVQIKI